MKICEFGTGRCSYNTQGDGRQSCAEKDNAHVVIAERLSARHLILQHALGQCMFVRHALLCMRARMAGA